MIVAVNVGSSSVRLAAYTPNGLHERARFAGDAPPVDALKAFAERLGRPVVALAHRVVHGGGLGASARLDATVEAELARLGALAPLHQGRALAWIRAARALFPSAPQVAVFDTGFFADLPAAATAYPLPVDLARRFGVRRWGFHGLAHRSLWLQWRAGRGAGGGRAVTLQLGGGCSAAAILDGKPVETSMGMTPLGGLVMATRPGDLDPGVLVHLLRGGVSLDELETTLHHLSGLRGLAGEGDFASLLARTDAEARLAVEVYCRRARQFLGGYLALLGGADAVLFGGGVGEHEPAAREAIAGGLDALGLALDPARNRDAIGGAARISGDGSRIEAWVFPVDEEALLAAEARRLLP